ncbi:MAG TPA: acyl carrier protein [Verrucomicrobiae bacterium]|nr:acyl carrier protein [Verrucomicrobiae bacterium]
MQAISRDAVCAFLAGRYADQLRGRGFEPAALPDDFDFLLSGVIDSLGVIEMISAVEQHFGITVDFETLDPSELTVLGPFSRFVAEHATSGNKSV